jgi:hypothetical protein
MTTRRLMLAMAVVTLLAGAGMDGQTAPKDEDESAGVSDSRARLHAAEGLLEASQNALKAQEVVKVSLKAQIESWRRWRDTNQLVIDSHKGATGLQQIEDAKILDEVAAQEQTWQKEVAACESELSVSEAQVAESEAIVGLCRADLRARIVPGPASVAVWEQARTRLAEAHLKTAVARKLAADAKVSSAEAGLVAAQKKVAAARAKSTRTGAEVVGAKAALAGERAL